MSATVSASRAWSSTNATARRRAAGPTELTGGGCGRFIVVFGKTCSAVVAMSCTSGARTRASSRSAEPPSIERCTNPASMRHRCAANGRDRREAAESQVGRGNAGERLGGRLHGLDGDPHDGPAHVVPRRAQRAASCSRASKPSRPSTSDCSIPFAPTSSAGVTVTTPAAAPSCAHSAYGSRTLSAEPVGSWTTPGAALSGATLSARRRSRP
jgi:hypothetical protein